MSMCIECKMCHFSYGQWRPQCPACGHKTPPPVFNDALSTAMREPRRRAPRERRQTAKTVCAFCRVRGARDSCTTCGVLIHSTCRRLHEAAHP